MTLSDEARIEMSKYLESLNGKEIRQKDLIHYLTTIKNNKYSQGVIRGILNKLDGIDGIYIPIPGVVKIKKQGAAFYKFEASSLDKDPIKKDEINKSAIDMLYKELLQFEDNINKQQLNVLDLSKKDTETYFKFVNLFQDMKQLLKSSSNNEE